jgi:hypothetical protein
MKSSRKNIKRGRTSKRYRKQRGGGKAELFSRIVCMEKEIHEAEVFQAYNPGQPYYQFKELRKQQEALIDEFNTLFPESTLELSVAIREAIHGPEVKHVKSESKTEIVELTKVDPQKQEQPRRQIPEVAKVHVQKEVQPQRPKMSWVEERFHDSILWYQKYIEPMLHDASLLNAEIDRIDKDFGEYSDNGGCGGYEARLHRTKQKMLFDALKNLRDKKTE